MYDTTNHILIRVISTPTLHQLLWYVDSNMLFFYSKVTVLKCHIKGINTSGFLQRQQTYGPHTKLFYNLISF